MIMGMGKEIDEHENPGIPDTNFKNWYS